MTSSLVGSEMCIRDRNRMGKPAVFFLTKGFLGAGCLVFAVGVWEENGWEGCLCPLQPPPDGSTLWMPWI
eukprot:107498-Prorocentrum_lima.AAC.1